MRSDDKTIQAKTIQLSRFKARLFQTFPDIPSCATDGFTDAEIAVYHSEVNMSNEIEANCRLTDPLAILILFSIHNMSCDGYPRRRVFRGPPWIGMLQMQCPLRVFKRLNTIDQIDYTLLKSDLIGGPGAHGLSGILRISETIVAAAGRALHLLR